MKTKIFSKFGRVFSLLTSHSTLHEIACCSLLLAASLLTSCSDDEKYDVVGNPNNLLYFSMADVSAPRTFSIAKTPIGNFGGFETQYPVFCTRNMAKETTVKAAVDNALVEAYNEEHATEYAAIPDGVVDLTQAVAHFHAGAVAAYDSLRIVVPDANLGALTEDAYLIPVRLDAVTGDGKGSEERGVLYLVLTLTEQLVNERAQVSDLRGTMISTDVMTTWTEASGLQLSRLGDDNRATTWARGTRTIDMLQTYKVSGLKLLTRYENGTFSQGVTLEISTDGSDWQEIGTLTTMPRDDDDYQYFILYGGVPARYLRITYGATTLGELRVYAE